MKGSDKAPVTFESETELHDTIASVVYEINKAAESDQRLSPYVRSVDQMNTLFQLTHGKNVRILEILQEMNAVILMNVSKVQLIARTTDADHASLSKMKGEYEEAARMVNLAHESEQRSKLLLANLRTSLRDCRSRCGEERRSRSARTGQCTKYLRT